MQKTEHYVRPSTAYKRAHKADYGKEKIDVLYEDKDIIIIHKPCGLLSCPYPGSKMRTAQDLLERMLRARGELSSGHKPLVVHRLDRDTSGVMMFALNEPVQKKIMRDWHGMVTERLYRAVAENPRHATDALPESGMIDEPLAQNARHVGYVKNKADDNARTVPARTHFKIIRRGKTHTLFELSLDTGKKNQIRAHLSSRHYPLAGDENYRARTDPFGRLCLHARTLAFVHPVTQERMRFEIPEPAEWEEYVIAGDPSPRTPIWRLERKYKGGPDKEDFSDARIIGSKEMRRMDFIQRGKLRGK